MKTNNQIIKKRMFAITSISKVIALTLIVSMASCTKSNKAEDTKEVAEELNEEKFEKSNENEAEYLVKAAEINLEEIELGQLAQTASNSIDVQQLGKMMETEHANAFAELKGLSEKKQITIPLSLTDKGIDAKKKLSDLKGTKFDKEYCSMMVQGHKDAIDHFEKIIKDSSDPQIKDWAIAVLPSLRTHLDHAITCKDKCDKID